MQHGIQQFHHYKGENLISDLFAILSKPPQQNSQQERLFYMFIEQGAPHDKCTYKINF